MNSNNYVDAGERFTMSVDYNWQLGDVDYVGFTYSTDEYLDFHHISAKYFMDLADESYLTLGATYLYDNTDDKSYDDRHNNDDFWSTNASYYFNDKTSISADYNENDIYNLSANHFINKNYAVGAFYSASSKSDFEGFDSYGVTFTAQF